MVASGADRPADLVRTPAGVDVPARIRAWGGSETGPADDPVLVVRSRRASRRLLWRPGELGLARAYLTGDIDVEGDLTDGPRLSGRPLTRRRDRAAIAHHYDLSNDFYRLPLDDRVRLGRLTLYAAQRYGVRATGITLSAQQCHYTFARAGERGQADSVEIRLQDYRDFDPAAFDSVASGEMGEHVGEQLYPTYVGIFHRALRPGGRLWLQRLSRRADAAPGGVRSSRPLSRQTRTCGRCGRRCATCRTRGSRSCPSRRCASTTRTPPSLG
jgi:cyclopropane-fatty-acyl-phospholipid synthase